ncbi:MAG: hypothetical protein PHE83_05610 [Opitutaceae bacterium]|nr:hypothetical protein [Opitutaceae bacterium]
MNTAGKLLAGAALYCLVTLSVLAQESVPGKVYVAEIIGGVTFTVGGKVMNLKKSDSLPIQGARIETAVAASVILVYSNGTSIYIDEKTIVEIRKFIQQPFASGVDTAVFEPSVSDTLASVTQGRVIITTNELASGTSMIYLTPQSQVKIRGKEVVIEVQDQETRIYLLSGNATVTPQDAGPDSLGQPLQGGQTAVVTNSAADSATIQVTALDQNYVNSISLQVAAAERAQKIVVFQTVSPPDGGPPEIQAKSVVSVNLPVPLTVSPSTLRTGD